MLVVFSPKSACSSVVIWFFHQLGLAEEARAYDFWPHNYREQVYYESKLYRDACSLDLTHFKVVRVVRDPFERAISAFRHVQQNGTLDDDFGRYLGRTDTADGGLSFCEFLDLLERLDLKSCNSHVAIQQHPIESKLAVTHLINVSTENLFDRLNQVEVDVGLPVTDFERMGWLLDLQLTRDALKHRRIATEDAYTLRLTRSQALAGPWPSSAALLSATARDRIARLYATDLLAYGKASPPRSNDASSHRPLIHASPAPGPRASLKVTGSPKPHRESADAHEEGPERESGAERKSRADRLQSNLLADLPLKAGAGAAARPEDWRWAVGGLTYFNKKPHPSRVPIVEDVPLTAETLPSAFVSAAGDPASPAQAHSGAVYRDDGKIVPEFREYDELARQRGAKSGNALIVEQARIDRAARSEMTGIYMGPLSRHLGQFLLESLSRAWYLKEADAGTTLLFHGPEPDGDLPPLAISTFEALEIDPSRIKMISHDIKVAKLILPSSQFRRGIKASPGICVIFDLIRERMLKSRGDLGRTPPKIYIPKRRVDGTDAGGSRRVISNEREAERFFRKMGYSVVIPGLLPPEELVAMVANATHIAGPSSPALHLMLFNNNPRTKLIELRMNHSVDQLLISAIRRNVAFHIWSRTDDSSPEKMMIDMEVVERAMQEIE